MSVTIVPHNAHWAAAYEDEARAIRQALEGLDITLHHIGSTSIPGIMAKPILDLMGEVQDLDELDRFTPAITRLGYEVMGEFGISGRRYFRKVNASGQRTHHLHVFTVGSAHTLRHLAFRDYLRSHPEVAVEYSEMKQRLVAQPGSTAECYMNGKDPFIKQTEARAVEWYRSQQG